ncbi:MAG: hypothetical protein IKR40_00485 [Treponema sp.]|nr:hypothetical protein [Treponema sp.]
MKKSLFIILGLILFLGFKTRIEITDLLGEWDSEKLSLSLDGDGTFNLGRKESEGLGGHWALLDDETILVSDAQTYDEDPISFEWKIKELSPDRLVIDSDGYILEFKKIYSTDGL